MSAMELVEWQEWEQIKALAHQAARLDAMLEARGRNR